MPPPQWCGLEAGGLEVVDRDEVLGTGDLDTDDLGEHRDRLACALADRGAAADQAHRRDAELREDPLLLEPAIERAHALHARVERSAVEREQLVVTGEADQIERARLVRQDEGELREPVGEAAR